MCFVCCARVCMVCCAWVHTVQTLCFYVHVCSVHMGTLCVCVHGCNVYLSFCSVLMAAACTAGLGPAHISCPCKLSP